MDKSVYINSICSVSAAGSGKKALSSALESGKSLIEFDHTDGLEANVAKLPANIQREIQSMEGSIPFGNLDPTVLYGIFVSRMALEQSGLAGSKSFGINFGSSRGATLLTEKFHEHFLKSGQVETLASPTTTMGNISSWIAQDLEANGPVITHSITCSTALHGVINAIAWIQSGMSDHFLVGGSEAPLTRFTVAQMKAMKIYSTYRDEFPCKTLDLNKSYNSMVLGEGASAMVISKERNDHSLAEIIGLGYGSETLSHPASLSTDALCFQTSMAMALDSISPEQVDAIVTHAPGTKLGDKAEVTAIKKVFNDTIPALTNNKWLIGHTLGASGAMSLDMAVRMLVEDKFFEIPYIENKRPDKLEHILVNAVGFGGNAVSILLKRV